ncbi:MAG: hypothetical protein QOF14_1117 [Hyphomicrobiales bacterium]|jgi:hypothetical protein|nr:hypothetical protein [Hyphomicrobiales bacterium]
MLGHGVFVYDPREAKSKHGSWDGAAKAIADLDMSHAWIRTHSKDGLWRTEENKALAAALKARGIKVFAWGWCDGNSVQKDIDNVESTLSEYSLDGYVADIEHGVSGANWTTARINQFCAKVRQLVGNKPFLVSTFGFLPYHEPQLMAAADPYVDAFAPQVYWFKFPNQGMLNQPGAHGPYALNNAAAYTNLCIDVWKHVVSKPLVITGQVYWGESAGWTQALAERKLQEFIDGFDRYDEIAGLNWWHFAGNKAMSDDMAAKIAAAKFGSRLGGDAPAPQAASALAAALSTGQTAYARVDALNLRTAPGDDPSTVIVALDIGQKLGVLGDSNVPGWKKVSAEIDDRIHEGHVFAKYIRPPESASVENLLKAAHTEWFRFQRGRGAEASQPYSDYVGEMWRELDILDRDGTDSQHPWSAAFISWIVKKAGYQNFLFSQLHAEYVHQAVRRRELSIEGPFWGFRLNEHRPALGDIVCQWRPTNDAHGNPILIDYDYAEDHDDFFGHCDVVVQVNEASVRTIGGNTGQELGHGGSVSMKTYRLTANGFLMDESRVFAIMRNNLRA